MKVGFVSLGCPKNQLDTEVMLHEVATAGYEITPEETEADVVIINTCGFIESAKQEAIENILDIAWLKKNKPNLIRGQLVYDYRRSRNDLPGYLQFALKHNLLNFLTYPDFIAYQYCDRKASVTTDICRRLWKAQGVSWTLKTREEYDTAVKEGWLPIFEGFRP